MLSASLRGGFKRHATQTNLFKISSSASFCNKIGFNEAIPIDKPFQPKEKRDDRMRESIDGLEEQMMAMAKGASKTDGRVVFRHEGVARVSGLHDARMGTVPELINSCEYYCNWLE